jgi:hypothetical protein
LHFSNLRIIWCFRLREGVNKPSSDSQTRSQPHSRSSKLQVDATSQHVFPCQDSEAPRHAPSHGTPTSLHFACRCSCSRRSAGAVRCHHRLNAYSCPAAANPNRRTRAGRAPPPLSVNESTRRSAGASYARFLSAREHPFKRAGGPHGRGHRRSPRRWRWCEGRLRRPRGRSAQFWLLQ